MVNTVEDYKCGLPVSGEQDMARDKRVMSPGLCLKQSMLGDAVPQVFYAQPVGTGNLFRNIADTSGLLFGKKVPESIKGLMRFALNP